jgi:hypothetical protein
LRVMYMFFNFFVFGHANLSYHVTAALRMPDIAFTRRR